MSGILGLFDPDGVDVGLVERAGAASAFRGSSTVTSINETLAFGVLARRVDDASLDRRISTVLALDGRVDAVIRGPAEPERGGSGVSLLHERIRREGPGSLNDFAAEFALAFADQASGDLLLARDAFGLHPLFFAERGTRFGFASDPQILVAMQVASGDLDQEVVSAYLARQEPLDGRTAFRGIRELVPGSWLRFRSAGSYESGRWFVPERLQGPRLSRAEAVEALQEAVGAAVRVRVRGRRCGVSLSGGRDSGSVAIAAAREGIEAIGITQTFDRDLPVAEDHLARALCERHQLGWLAASVRSCPTPAQLDDVPRWSGTPMTYFGFAQATAVVDVAAREGIEVLLNGEGGEPLFTASEVSVLDLSRSGRLKAAARAARNFHVVWGHSYERLAKVAGRAVAPRALLRNRERIRPTAPWIPRTVVSEFFEATAPRSDRHGLMMSLRSPHPAGFDLEERMYQTRGVEPAYPLLDLRVVSVALSLDLSLRAPIDRPKPALAAAFLGDLADDRLKMSFVPYYQRLGMRMQQTYPELFAADGLAARGGFIERAGLGSIGEERWLIESLGVAVLELWLRRPL